LQLRPDCPALAGRGRDRRRLIMPRTVLVIAPHPDDESIGCGGSICLHRQRGDRVQVVFLTSGERGVAGVPPEAARSIREAEAAESPGVLGGARMDFLRLRDLGLWGAVEPAAYRLREVLGADPPSLIYLPHPGEAHPDHGAALLIVRAALAQAFPAGALPGL